MKFKTALLLALVLPFFCPFVVELSGQTQAGQSISPERVVLCVPNRWGKSVVTFHRDARLRLTRVVYYDAKGRHELKGASSTTVSEWKMWQKRCEERKFCRQEK